MGGRDRMFVADPDAEREEKIVRAAVEAYFLAEDAGRLEELEENFELFHSLVEETVETLDFGPRAGERSFEALPAEFAFFAGSAVTSAIWAATRIYRHLADRSQRPDEKLEAALAMASGNPQMIRRIHHFVADQLQEMRSLLHDVEDPAPAGRASDLRVSRRRQPFSEPRELRSFGDLGAVQPALPAAREDSGRADPDLLLFVESRSDGRSEKLFFKLHARRPDLELEYTEMGSSQPLPADLDERIALFAREAEKLHDSGRDPVGAARRLESLGISLAEQLLPEPLLAALETLRGQAETLIVHSEAQLPWELFRFPRRRESPGAFFCEAFALAVWLPKRRAVFELPLRHLGVIAPDSDLEATAAEAEALFALAGAGRRVEELPSRRSLLIRSLGDLPLDGIHFAGHGTTSESSNADFACLRLAGDEVLDAVDLEPDSLPARPLVFLNACHSGAGAPALTRIGGLARGFVRAGAAAVIGSHWTINDRLAATFAAEVYGRLLRGIPLAPAVRAARLQLRDDHPGDPTWMAYTVFGQPLAACRAVEKEDQVAGTESSGS